VKPLISVLIVNFNTKALLEDCLSSVFGSLGNFDLEVLVADNGSSDESIDLVEQKFSAVRCRKHEGNRGFSFAVNELIGAANGDFFLILHPDVELHPDAISAFLSFFSRMEKAGILGGNLFYPDGRPNPCEIMFPGLKRECLSLGLRLMARLPLCESVSVHRSPLEWSHQRTESVNWVWNACMMIRKDVLDQIGRFDEGFFVWFADWDFCQRAREAFWRVYYIEDAKVVHHERQSFLADREDMLELRYKVDGWYSVAGQIRDRCRFLNKHVTAASRFGTKVIAFTENTLKLCAIVARLSLGRTGRGASIFQLKACLEVLRAISAA
jgi:GT2 family glycosyltransferase